MTRGLGDSGGIAIDVVGFIVFGVLFVALRFFLDVIVFEFDGIIEIAGVGSIEDGNGAAAFFVGRFGFVERFDERAEGIEASVGEFFGVWRHRGPLGKGVHWAAGKMALHLWGGDTHLRAQTRAEFCEKRA